MVVPLSVPKITPAVDWLKSLKLDFEPITKNLSVPSSLNLIEFVSPTVIVEVDAPTNLILPSPKLILA